MSNLKVLRCTLLTGFHVTVSGIFSEMSQLCCPILGRHATIKRPVDLKSRVMRHRRVHASILNFCCWCHCFRSSVSLLTQNYLGRYAERSDVVPRFSYSSTPTQLVHQEDTSYFSGSFDSRSLVSHSCNEEFKSLPVKTLFAGSLLFRWWPQRILQCSQRICKQCLVKGTQQLLIVNAFRR